MPRKSPKKKKQLKKIPLLLIGILFLIILLGSLFYYNLNRVSPCANSQSCEESLTLKVENGATGVFQGNTVQAPEIDLTSTQVLGIEDQIDPENPASEKHIYVNLKTQTLSAYDGDDLFMTAKVSTGLWGWTPTGEFTIWTKIRSTRMSGGSGADYYNLPNVPYVMYFSNAQVPASRGFGIHGAYWHNNFGHAMSHGCINMREIDVAKLYEWATPYSTGSSTRSTAANPGTKITILSGEEDVQK